MSKRVAIIGGGPSGLMLGYQLSKAGVKYTLIERNPLLGKKLLITGSSRCNVTNNRENNDFINDLTLKHKKFLYSTIQKFGSKEVIEFFKDNGVPLLLENNLKYFPKSNRSVDILNVLRDNQKGKIMLNTEVKSINKDSKYILETSKGVIETDILIIATGSMSYPQTGSKGDGLRFAKNLGHKFTKFYPAETNVFSKQIASKSDSLQGITLLKSKVSIRGSKNSVIGPLLFTHFGLSGPSIQHLSEFIYFSLIEGKDKIEISLTNHSEIELNELFNSDSNKNDYLLKVLSQLTIKRLAKFLIEELKIKNDKLSQISKKDKNRLINNLTRYEVLIDRVEGVEKAYVNGGGVSTKELNPKTFESKLHNDLYFLGETVDMHGPIGGYNITLAFSSAFSSSLDIIDKCK